MSKEYIGYKSIKFGTMFIWIITLIILIILFCMCIFEIDVVLKAQGIVRPDKNISIVKNVYSGKINEINYKNGMEVNKGDKLYQINNFDSINEKRNVEIELDRLRNESKGIIGILNSLTHKEDLIEEESEYYTKYKEFLIELERLQLYEEKAFNIYKKNEKLGLKFISLEELNKSRREYKLSRLNREKYEVEFEIKYKDKLKEREILIEKLEKNLEKINEELRLSMVTAPITGVVQVEKKVNIGDYINSGEVLIKIIPKDYKVKMDIYIDNKDISKTKIGQEIKYRVHPLSYKEYGMSKGSVVSISKDSNYLKDGRYLVEGSIETTELENRQGRVEKIPIGALTDVRIVVKRKKIINYILEQLNFLEEV